MEVVVKGEPEVNKQMELFHEKEYKFQADRGSKVQLKIEAKIQEMNKEDMEDILHEVAIYTHNFYLDLGKKIASTCKGEATIPKHEQ